MPRKSEIIPTKIIEFFAVFRHWKTQKKWKFSRWAPCEGRLTGGRVKKRVLSLTVFPVNRPKKGVVLPRKNVPFLRGFSLFFNVFCRKTIKSRNFVEMSGPMSLCAARTSGEERLLLGMVRAQWNLSKIYKFFRISRANLAQLPRMRAKIRSIVTFLPTRVKKRAAMQFIRRRH